MKKFLLIICAAALLMAGCGGESESREPIKVGTVRYMNVTEDALNKFNEQQLESVGTQPKYKYVFFDNMPSMTSALLARQIDEFSTYETVADYLIMQNQRFDRTPGEHVMIDMFCCAMRADDVALKAEFDAAIQQMHREGTFTDLVKNYINNIHHAVIPNPIAMPTFEGAKTVRIGVTGDLPRMDYIRADGVPAGFNTAVLAEISKCTKKNFVLMQIDSGARAVALLSGVVDVIFWAAVADKAQGVPEEFDKPSGMIFTEPYFSDKIVHVTLKK